MSTIRGRNSSTESEPYNGKEISPTLSSSTESGASTDSGKSFYSNDSDPYAHIINHKYPSPSGIHIEDNQGSTDPSVLNSGPMPTEIQPNLTTDQRPLDFPLAPHQITNRTFLGQKGGSENTQEQSTTATNIGDSNDSGSFVNVDSHRNTLVSPNFTSLQNRLFLTDQFNAYQKPACLDTRKNVNIEHIFPRQQPNTPHALPVDLGLKDKKGCNMKKKAVVVFVCLCLAGVITYILLTRKIIFPPEDAPIQQPDTAPLSCKESGNIGKPACYAPASTCSGSFKKEKLNSITIKHISSEFYKFTTKQQASVYFSDNIFNSVHGGWFVDYNNSTGTSLIGKLNMTCHDVGDYTVTFHYEDSQNFTCTFDIKALNPTIQLSSYETQDYIYINCEITNMCSETSLAIFIHDGNLTYPVLNEENNCESRVSKRTKEVAVLKSLFSENYKVLCKPLTDDINLIKNLTKTMSLCKGKQCSNSCTKEEKGYYFQHPYRCDKFYQCEHPALHLRPCPEKQQWNPEKCTCTLPDGVVDQCNNNTKMYDPPLNIANIKACGGPGTV